MSWDVVVVGELTLAAAARDQWKKVVPPRELALPPDFPPWQASVAGGDVDSLIERAAGAATFDQLGARKDTWSCRLVLAEDPYRDLAASLAAAVAAAHGLGGRGEVLFYGWTTAPAGHAHRLVLDASGVSFAKLSAD